jgi:beta-xylosidase
MAAIHNPIVPGWYADPEARCYNGRYYVYVTQSFTAFEDQRNLDMFSSDDLVHWQKHKDIVEMEGFPHVKRAVWAPTVIEKGGKYYLIFASNDIHHDEEPGGLEIAVSDKPEGPFRAYLGRPLVGSFINGAQPIDAHLFKDDDGAVYLYYGGWGHCNAAVMNDTMDGFVPFADGERFHEITPPSYVEGPCMLNCGASYFFIWSLGDWTNGSYRVKAAAAASPLGPFGEPFTLLEGDGAIADGPGHPGYLHDEQTGEWFLVYHRRYIGDKEPGHRVLCIDRMQVTPGGIGKVVMTESFEK